MANGGFIPLFIKDFHGKDVVPYVGDGSNPWWPPVHVLQGTAELYKLAVDCRTLKPGTILHGIQDEEIEFKNIMGLIDERHDATDNRRASLSEWCSWGIYCTTI